MKITADTNVLVRAMLENRTAASWMDFRRCLETQRP
jgi:hypothetical protein